MRSEARCRSTQRTQRRRRCARRAGGPRRLNARSLAGVCGDAAHGRRRARRLVADADAPHRLYKRRSRELSAVARAERARRASDGARGSRGARPVTKQEAVSLKTEQLTNEADVRRRREAKLRDEAQSSSRAAKAPRGGQGQGHLRGCRGSHLHRTQVRATGGPLDSKTRPRQGQGRGVRSCGKRDRRIRKAHQ